MSGGLIALLLATPVLARELPPGFVYLRDVDAEHRAGHALCGLRQFHRPSAVRLWRRRMRAAARRGAGAGQSAGRSRRTVARAEGLRLLPPDPRGRRLCALVAAEGRRRDQALLSGAGQARPVCRRLHRRAFGAFDRQRGRSDAGAAPRPAGAAVRSARILRRLHRAGRQTRARQCARHGHRLRLPRSQELAPWPARPRRSKTTARVVLLEAMRKRGFHNYFREWWHFSFGTRERAYDFAIEPRSSSTSP